MSVNLLESIKGVFNNEFVTKASQALGEDEENIQTALSASIPSVLTGFLKKGNTLDGLTHIIQLSKTAFSKKFSSNIFKIVEGNKKYDKATNMAENIFGDNLSDVSQAVSLYAGIKETSATALLKTIAPVSLSVLGEHITTNKMEVTDAAHLIANQKDAILGAHPYSFNIANALGFNHIGEVGYKFSDSLSQLPAKVTTEVSEAVKIAKASSEKSNFFKTVQFWIVLKWALLLLFFILLIVLINDIVANHNFF